MSGVQLRANRWFRVDDELGRELSSHLASFRQAKRFAQAYLDANCFADSVTVVENNGTEWELTRDDIRTTGDR